MSRAATSFSGYESTFRRNSSSPMDTFTVKLPEVGAPLGMSYGEADDIIYVGEVEPGGPFSNAGILPGDILTIDGKRINSETALLNVVRSLKEAGRTEFQVVMATQEQTGSDVSVGTYLSSNFVINRIPGATKALLICVSYKKRPDIALYGQGRRAEMFHGLVKEAGFKDVKIICDEIHMGIRPSKTNITQGLRWLAKGAKPGDNLIILASGHGYNSLDEEDGDIAIAPIDFAEYGCVTCTNVRNLLLSRLPDGCRLFVVNDFYKGGSLYDLPFEVSLPPSGQYEVIENQDDVSTLKSQVFMLSLQSEGYGPRVGQLTTMFLKSMKGNDNPTLQSIVDDIRDELDRGRERSDTLTPLVSSNRRFDIQIERFCDPPESPKRAPTVTPDSSVSSRGFVRRPSEGRKVLAVKKHPPPPPWLVGEYRGRDLLYDPLPDRTHADHHANTVDPRFRARLIQFYRYHNPSQLPRVTCMLIQYRGKETQLFAELVRKYGEEPANIFKDLPAGWTKVASSKGEVFL
eukprot:TRINITY_DN10367_c0_g1_i1.p1 TRINITY_DN10367_c0_g1~~TRINITY_DN10367_c0_g1_i1.p1  ORF type:complete len:531 (+),score=72.54 TRINITY_DN10367_c0_g1_i1:45-1595(+)